MHANQWRQGLIVGVLFVLAFGLISLIWGLSDKMQIAVTEAHNAERQYQALEERKAALEANLAALSTARGQDGAIRTAFGVARPGEEVIVVVPPEAKAPTSTPTWWEKILNWF
jgi:cell division protein FtsB